MGIRYYAYAFDNDRTEQALADPRSVMGGDPLADAWGLEPGAQVSRTNFVQAVSKTEMLYLDKAWRPLQRLTAPAAPGMVPRPAHLMFEGYVTPQGVGWISWVRALRPEEVQLVADDLRNVEVSPPLDTSASDWEAQEAEYAAAYLDRAREFVTHLAANRRGLAYMIG